VEDILVKLATLSDLVFVFLDPMGKAACKRTLNVVERMTRHPSCASKLRYYLSKADTVENMADLLKVSSQVTRDLTPVVNVVNFELPTLFVPPVDEQQQQQQGKGVGFSDMTTMVPTDPVSMAFRAQIPNHIHQVTHEIEMAIQQSVQRAIHSVEKDCASLLTRIDTLLTANARTVQSNAVRSRRLFLSTLFAILLPLLLVPLLFPVLSDALVGLILSLVGGGGVQTAKVTGGGGSGSSTLETTLLWVPHAARWVDTTVTQHGVKWTVVTALAVLVFLLIVIPRICWSWKPHASAAQLATLRRHRETVKAVLSSKHELYERLFQTIRSGGGSGAGNK
jgi:hypothetical protein